MTQSLQELERDVAATRARLARNLDTLRSPGARNEFTDALKHEAFTAKDDLLERTRSAARQRAQEWVDTLKARAAENPAAILFIAAGLGWRVLRDPPIASALVGVGLWSLFRGGTPLRSGRSDDEYLEMATARLRQQSSELAAAIAERTRAAAAKASDDLGTWRDEAGAAVRQGVARTIDQAVSTAAAASEQVGAVAQSAREAAEHSVEQVRQSASDIRDDMTDRSERLAEIGRQRVNEFANGAAERAIGLALDRTDPTAGRELADKLLLGVAGAAVAAAVGMALQRRMLEVEPTE